MKMKEVCAATGLTRRTILFYEEQGFISPGKTRMNGREYREYSRTEIDMLLKIAALRKCCFTIEEIKNMLAADDRVRPAFAAYRQRLVCQQEELKVLLNTIEGVQEESLHNISDLLEAIQRPAEELPIPETDCVPRFRYLDEMEEELAPPREPSKYHQDQRPVEVDSDMIFVDASMGKKKLLDDLKKDLDSRPVYGVPEKKGGPRFLEWLKTPIVILLVLLFFTLPASSKNGIGSRAFLEVAAGILALIAVYVIIVLIQRYCKK